MKLTQNINKFFMSLKLNIILFLYRLNNVYSYKHNNKLYYLLNYRIKCMFFNKKKIMYLLIFKLYLYLLVLDEHMDQIH